jgi:hypothetical protein
MKKLSEIFEKHHYLIAVIILLVAYCMLIVDACMRYDTAMNNIKKMYMELRTEK